MIRVAALVPDLMDRSRLSVAGAEVRFVRPAEVADLADVDLLVVDLARPGALDAIGQRPAGVVVVGFGPHVEGELLAAARAAGCDRVLPRSKFFAAFPDV